MIKQTSSNHQNNDSWDTYWKGTGDIGAFTSGGVSHPVIHSFWEDYFTTIKQDYEQPEILDIASGNGAIIATALAILDNKPNAITSLDISSAAIENIKNRFPTVKGIVSDASSIPLEDACFDIVTSQFGLEYAGQKAIPEVSRMVKDKGQLTLLLHSDSGSIHQECIQSLDAVERMKAAGFIPMAIEMFDAGFKAVAGADRTPYDEAAKKFSPAISELESIMTQYGQHVAGDTIIRLYNDVAQIHQRIQHYEPDEILNWLKKMDTELEAYAGRMSSMSQAAISELNFKEIQSFLCEQGFSIQRAETLNEPNQDIPIAWVLIATK